MTDIDRLITRNVLLRSANETDPEEFMPAMAEAADPKRTYLHTDRDINGSDFDPSKIDLINSNDGKPQGTLYGSEYWPKGKETSYYGIYDDEPTSYTAYSSWDEWVPDNIGDDWLGANGFTYKYTPQSRVYRVNKDRDLLNIPKKFWKPSIYQELQRRIHDQHRSGDYKGYDATEQEIRDGLVSGKLTWDDIAHVLDYKALAKEFDAIDFSDEVAKKLEWSERVIGPGHYVVPILSAGQTILLNPDAVTDVMRWKRPGREEGDPDEEAWKGLEEGPEDGSDDIDDRVFDDDVIDWGPREVPGHNERDYYKAAAEIMSQRDKILPIIEELRLDDVDLSQFSEDVLKNPQVLIRKLLEKRPWFMVERAMQNHLGAKN